MRSQPSYFEVVLMYSELSLLKFLLWFLEAVASLGLVMSLNQSVRQSVSLSAFSKIRKIVFQRKYKGIQKVIIRGGSLSRSGSVTQSVCQSPFSKIRKRVFKRKYK